MKNKCDAGEMEFEGLDGLRSGENTNIAGVKAAIDAKTQSIG